MAGRGYESGRLNLPFVGIASFAKKPVVADWADFTADAAILGAPFDDATYLGPEVAIVDMGDAEKDYVTGLTQVGIRNVTSTAREGYDAARAMDPDILSVRPVRAFGIEGVLARIPIGARVYLTVDIDAFCPSIAPGTGTHSHGGFLYHEVVALLQGVAAGTR